MLTFADYRNIVKFQIHLYRFMGKANPVLTFVGHNKYWIVAIIAVLIVGVVDENSFYRRMKNNMQIADLRNQISQYNERYEKDEAQLRELRHNPKAITKIARERYFMKTDDEDIFVLSTELPEASGVAAAPVASGQPQATASENAPSSPTPQAVQP